MFNISNVPRIFFIWFYLSNLFLVTPIKVISTFLPPPLSAFSQLLVASTDEAKEAMRRVTLITFVVEALPSQRRWVCSVAWTRDHSPSSANFFPWAYSLLALYSIRFLFLFVFGTVSNFCGYVIHYIYTSSFFFIYTNYCFIN